MKEALYSLCTGIVAGGIFSFFKLPIPAPNNYAGVLGIIGLFLGYMIVQHFFKING